MKNNMKLNSIYEVKIIDEDKLGHGIARIDNCVVFVKGTFIDEIITIKIIELKKRYAVGQLLEIKKKSIKRKCEICEYYNLCGGCDYLHIDLKEELENKLSIIKNYFKDYNVKDIVYGNCFNYRNKVTFHVENSKIGFYKKNTNELIEISSCLLVNENILNVYNLINNINLKGLNEVIIKISNLNEIMIIFDNKIKEEDINYLVSNDNLIKSIYINDNLIYGTSYITNNFNGIIYTVGPKSFMQVNYDMMIRLYDKIKYYTGNGNNLLDLYCGVGSISIYLKDNYKNITGIEIVEEAIKNANINKSINNISNINFICGDAKEVKNNKYDTIIVDPPRSGLEKSVINKILNNNSNKLIYVSCNYKTLKRDIEYLKNKYKVVEISVFNMFPKTLNIECVALLEKDITN